MYNHRGEPTGTNHKSTPQAEQFRLKAHPLQGTGGLDTVGIYQGKDNATNFHFFSADATGGGSTDSIMVPHNEASRFIGDKGTRYAFKRDGSSADATPYFGSKHYGIAGAPLSDTPSDMADHKFK